MVELEIDGKKTTAEEGASIIEAADEMGVYIPRFCYHKKLSVAANCRMCLVEVEKSGKPLPACATPVTAGMKVFTQSKKALEAQRAVMEFLLINHPLDCPICDQGGECELQDLAMGFGRAHSNYEDTKRAVFSDDIGPLIETEMTRCIQCTRCVRFGEEIAGLPELGVINRGEKEAISTYVKHFMRSELSGNIIDICPVGALTDKPARYQGRGWEYRETPSIAPHDCVGGNIFLHSRWQEFVPQREVMRAVPRENDEVNETWMSDRDRFGHFAVYHESRLYQPRIKKDGKWEAISWEDALRIVKEKTQAIIEKHGASQTGALLSPSATIEEYFLFQKWLRGLGSHNIDHRVRWQDFRDQNTFDAFPNLGMPITELENLNAILLIGSNVRFEQPLLSHRMNKAYGEGAKILAINPMDYPFVFGINEKMIVSPSVLIPALADVAKALAKEKSSEKAKVIAETLVSAEKAAIFLGEHALHHPEAAKIREWAHFIAQQSGATVGLLTEGANSAGAWLAGALPHRRPGGQRLDSPGLDAKAMLTTDPLKAYFLLNLEPEFDCAYPAQALHTLNQAEWVVAFTTFTTPTMESYADILLPIAPFSESGGTYVNAEGRWQWASAASVPEKDAQPAWKVLRVLGNYFDLPSFDYKTIEEVTREINDMAHDKSRIEEGHSRSPISVEEKPIGENDEEALTRFAPWPMVRVDHLVRRSLPLQETLAKEFKTIRLNTKTAKKFNFNEGDQLTAIQGESRITLPLAIDDRLADNTVLLASGLVETAGVGQAEAPIILERGQ
ncbi:NADH-quinone oxidoreductase subunit NuoG [Coxiella burnetii]|uniref:NADH-quinone oxidoreductase subunit NuoG n=1 Tax=Coxiella burnetii TaxID=777 RepID=UPI000CCC5C0B|nr:NADH-quinone oxidoreductase subunit NuoG [Coxiella burnetii]PNT89134.1 NADH-quinone oxidoreductase subunit G [Coxiella burnetii]